MKITFEERASEGFHTGSAAERSAVEERKAAARTARGQAAYRAELFRGGEGVWEDTRTGHRGRGSSLKELMQDAQAVDLEVLRNYRTVMSNTMSREDYARLENDGFSYEQLDPETAVTIVDRIKAELARSGQDVAGYTDDLDVDTLTSIVGSRSLALSIVDSFAANDIPLTPENVTQTMQAVSMAGELGSPQEGQYRYMVDNGMEPDIMSFYLAGSSVMERRGEGGTAAGTQSSGAGRAAAGVQGSGAGVAAAGARGSGAGVAAVRARGSGAGRAAAGQEGQGDGRTAGGPESQEAGAAAGQESQGADQAAAGTQYRRAGVGAAGIQSQGADRAAGGTKGQGKEFAASGIEDSVSQGKQESAYKRYQSGPEYYADEVEGYYSRSAKEINQEQLQGQIDGIITQAGLEVNSRTRGEAVWLLEQGLLLNPENLLRYGKLRGVSFPVEQNQAVRAAAAAIAGGSGAYWGNLSDTENIYQKASRLAEEFSSMEEAAFRGRYGELAARRQLEEIRFHMTAEVNVRLLRSGFSIDTAPMEELIKALKQAESQVAAGYFPQEEDSLEKYQSYRRTCQVVQDIPGLPAAVLGTFSARLEDGSLGAFHEEGKRRQDDYRRAGESYEALMTSPRGDMGDSIQKAFANVDDILNDLGLERSEENRRAARILGYNRMEITQENIERVSAADRKVRAVTQRMKPAATLRMIRDGINPLEQTMEELDKYLDNLPESYEDTAESYSRFLQGLEHNQEISPGERSAYIGIYRLLHQVEKSDGAYVGALVNSQAELNFANLLSASRTAKAGHMDAKVNDAFGAVAELTRRGVSISEQIEAGYGDAWKDVLSQFSEDPQAQEQRRAGELALARQAAVTEEECAKLLQRGSVPVNTGNLLAAAAMLGPAGAVQQRWMQRIRAGAGEPVEEAGTGAATIAEPEAASAASPESGTQEADNAGRTRELWEGLADGRLFGQEYRKALEKADEAVQAMTLEEADTSLDVRELRLLHKELHIASRLSGHDEYFIPVRLGEETTLVHLTLEQGGQSKGQVRAAMELAGMGRVEGHFQLQDGRVSGFFTGNTQESVTKLRRAADIFTDKASQKWETGSIQVLEGTSAAELAPSAGAQDDELYHVARCFLEALQTAAG